MFQHGSGGDHKKYLEILLDKIIRQMYSENMPKPETKETRTLLITKTDGEEIQIDIPSTYKVTFGPAFVGKKDEIGGKQVPMALRVYESDKMQLAIFTNVSSFRDIAIPMRIKKINTQTKQGIMEADGVKKATTFQVSTTEWLNPDADPQNEKKLLPMPTDQEMFGKD